MEVRIMFALFDQTEIKLVHCFDGDFRNGVGTIFDIQTLLLVDYADKAPTGRFLLESLLLVHAKQDELLKQWERING